MAVHVVLVCLGCLVTKYYRLDGLNSRHLFSSSFSGWESKIKALANLVSVETSLPNSQTMLSCCVLTWHFLWVHAAGDGGEEGEWKRKWALLLRTLVLLD